MKTIKIKRILITKSIKVGNGFATKSYEVKECKGYLFEHNGYSYCICHVEADSCYYAIEITTGMSAAKYGIYDYIDEGEDFTRELAFDKLKNQIISIPQNIMDKAIIKAKEIMALENIAYPINIR